jgi:hypothetical protein
MLKHGIHDWSFLTRLVIHTISSQIEPGLVMDAMFWHSEGLWNYENLKDHNIGQRQIIE